MISDCKLSQRGRLHLQLKAEKVPQQGPQKNGVRSSKSSFFTQMKPQLHPAASILAALTTHEQQMELCFRVFEMCTL